MTKKTDKVSSDTLRAPKISIKTYVEHFISKYKVLSSCDLVILVSHASKPRTPFDKIKYSISASLNKLKNEGKISKVGPGIWSWEASEGSYD